MQTKSLLLAALLAAGSIPALSTASPAQGCACPGGGLGIRAEEPPPPLPDYDQPPMPSPGYMWTPGYWAWNNVDYYWVPGVWVEPPRPGVLWTPGYWGFVGGVYVFNPGYWGPHVGFYGGVAYGFGYGGSGYIGGRWNNGVFFYNQSVSNVGVNVAVNVYNEPAPAASVSRASFNGGAGGTTARPTAQEEAAALEPHDKPTAGQIQQNRAASANAASFASTNHGVPAVAATAHPGALTGADVVRAHPAGAAAVAPAAAHAVAAPAVAPPVVPAPAAAPQPHALPRPAEAAPQTEHALPHPAQTAPQPSHAPPHPAEAAPAQQHAAPNHQPAERRSQAEPRAEHAPPHPQQAPQPRAEVRSPTAALQAHAPPAPHPAAPPHAVPPPHAQAGHPHCGAPGEPPCR